MVFEDFIIPEFHSCTPSLCFLVELLTCCVMLYGAKWHPLNLFQPAWKFHFLFLSRKELKQNTLLLLLLGMPSLFKLPMVCWLCLRSAGFLIGFPTPVCTWKFFYKHWGLGLEYLKLWKKKRICAFLFFSYVHCFLKGFQEEEKQSCKYSIL